MKDKKTLLLGASTRPERNSMKTLIMLSTHDIPTIGIGRGDYHIGDVEILGKWDWTKIQDIHTVTIYLNVENQSEYVENILELRPSRVIFNPGAENEEFQLLLDQENIEYLHACTAVLISTGQY